MPALLASLVVGGLATDLQALEPRDIVVLYNNKSMNSLEVARYYMAARKIPETHLIPVTCDINDNITEEDYRTRVVPQVLKGLSDRKLLPDAKAGITGVKCIVTTYDIPLRVLSRQQAPAEKDETAAYEKQLAALATQIAADAAAFDRIAPEPAPATMPRTTHPPSSWQEAAIDAQNAANDAGRRVERLTDAARTAALGEFVQLQEKVNGMAGVLNSLHVPANVPDDDPARKRLSDLGAQYRDVQARIKALEETVASPASRRELINAHQTAEGLAGEARVIESLLNYLKTDETDACFDNELALVLADQNYPRHGWILNPKNVEIWPSIQRSADAPPTLIVSRIDAMNVANAKKIVDNAIKVEATGLDGKIYLDARGLHGTDGYATFDADIRRAADWLGQHADMPVVLDDKPELLQAADCPDAALYCGWYSLRNYVDSCQWVPGSVAYHVASHEMNTLHSEVERGWVVNLLKHGVAGTMGATDEPYLSAFPKPSLFFPLLLSGKFTQGEVWELTAPMLSWQVGYVGDPLYNPFKVKPRVKVEDLKQHAVLKNAFEILNR